MQKKTIRDQKIFIAIVILFLTAAGMQLAADNPLVRHIFTADPAPIVYGDTFYIFCGHDEGQNNGWIMPDWHVLSSTDMANWTDHGPVLSVSDISWLNTDQAWASQCVERNGRFYFYICDSGEIGVVTSTNILGPYTDPLGRPFISNQTSGAAPGDDNIDPHCFIDDDGQAYLYWGTDRVVRHARLNSDMISIQGSITVPQGLNRFFEASWVHKRNGIYYYSYAAYNNAGDNWPSNIDYATSTSPMGPWTYRGTLNGAAGEGTNHPGIAEYKGRWYFVYHTDYLSGGTAWQRSVSIDLLHYNSDGTIGLIAQTDAGIAAIDTPPVAPGTDYRLVARHSGKVLEVANGGTAEGDNIQQQTYNGTRGQIWRFVEVGNGVYEIVNQGSGLCLDVNEGLVNDGTNVQQWSYWGGAMQQWKLLGSDEGYYTLVNIASRKVVDIDGVSTSDGANAHQWTYLYGENQQWEIVPVSAVHSPTPPVPVNRGDVDQDEAITIIDALITARFYVGLISNINQTAADVNCDNRITIVDALMIAQYYVGILNRFSC